MVIIETSVFTRIIKNLLSDDEYHNFLEALINRPEMGDLIRDAGGLRKVKWKREKWWRSGHLLLGCR